MVRLGGAIRGGGGGLVCGTHCHALSHLQAVAGEEHDAMLSYCAQPCVRVVGAEPLSGLVTGSSDRQL
jgi:hypothetical protein